MMGGGHLGEMIQNVVCLTEIRVPFGWHFSQSNGPLEKNMSATCYKPDPINCLVKNVFFYTYVGSFICYVPEFVVLWTL